MSWLSDLAAKMAAPPPGRRPSAIRPPGMVYGEGLIYLEGQYELADAFSPEGSLDIPLGIDPKGSSVGIAWSPQVLQGHALTFGATRSGKGVSAIIPALLTYQGSCLVIDPKGENAWVTAERRRQIGNRVVILDPWGEVNRRYAGGKPVETVTRFNPLSALRADDPDFADDVAAIADALIVSGEDLDSHWTNSARELVAGLIAAEVERKPPGQASIAAVRRLLTATNEEMTAEVDEIQKANPDSLAGRKLRRFTRDNEEVAGVRATAETQTAILDSARLLASMETGEPPFDMTELATGRVTLYLVLPPDRLQTHGRWLRMIITLAIRAITRQPEPPKVPCLFLLDECGTISPGSGLGMIEQAYGLLAGLGVRIWAFFQDINQLKRDYPNSWETFISNSAVIQVMNAPDLSTSQYISDMIGNTTVERISQGTARARKRNPKFAGHMTDQFLSRAVLMPQEVREINNKELLILLPGRGVSFYLKRIFYYSEPQLAGRFRSYSRS